MIIALFGHRSDHVPLLFSYFYAKLLEHIVYGVNQEGQLNIRTSEEIH